MGWRSVAATARTLLRSRDLSPSARLSCVPGADTTCRRPRRPPGIRVSRGARRCARSGGASRHPIVHRARLSENCRLRWCAVEPALQQLAHLAGDDGVPPPAGPTLYGRPADGPEGDVTSVGQNVCFWIMSLPFFPVRFGTLLQHLFPLPSRQLHFSRERNLYVQPCLLRRPV